MGGDYVSALQYLKKFSGTTYHDDRLPQALFEQGCCLARMGNYSKAIAVSDRNASDHPTDFYAYKSILLQADLYRSMGGKNLDFAAAIYGDILYDRYARFGVKSLEWRRAIFSLGETLYDLGRYKEAVLKLEEAISRFPEDAETPNAAYYLAMACRKAALSDPEMRQAFFLKSAKLFADMAASGAAKDDARARSAAFQEADCYYDLGDYQKALTRYDKAVEANVDTPDATRALFQIANCYHRLGMKDQADATYKRASFNLKHRQAAPAPGGQFYESLASWLGTEEKQG
jgi:tetratricopeptide (TPR) repeat protein